MAITNHERVGKAMELLTRRARARSSSASSRACTRRRRSPRRAALLRRRPARSRNKPIAEWDVAALLKLMWDAWNDVFRKTLGRAERTPGQRAARRAQQVGAPGAVLERRRLPRARLDRRGC